MPEEFPPQWEYYVPDPEIEEAIYSLDGKSVRVDVIDRIVAYGETDNGARYLDGFRCCPGQLLNTSPFSFRKYRPSSERSTVEQRQCANRDCGKLFYPRVREHVRQRYCSRQCSPHIGRKRLLPSFRKCEYPECGREFRPMWSGHKYCTKVCSNRQTSKERSRPVVSRKAFVQRVLEGESLGRVCPVCQTEIRVKELRGRAKYRIYCSKQCKIYVRNKRQYDKCQNVKMGKSC